MYFVLVLIAVTFLEHTDASTRCYECVDMPHPQDCPTVTTCSQHEICYVEQFVTSGGQILYNSGCLSKDRCKTAGKRAVPIDFVDMLRPNPIRNENNEGMAKRQETVSRTDIATCIQCCDGNYCNVEGCGTTAVARPNRGPKCFSCKAQADPESCRDTQLCDRDKVCAIYRPLDRLIYDEWATECMSALQCKAIVQVESAQLGGSIPAVGKRGTVTVNKCPRCCTDDLCNHSCRQNLTVIQSTISPTKPSTYPTIKPATKFITVPTHPTTKSTTMPTTYPNPPSATSTHSTKPTIKHTPPTTKPTVGPAVNLAQPTTQLTIKHTHPMTKPTTKPTIKHTHPTTKPTTKPTIKHTHPTTKPTIKPTIKHTHSTTKPTTKPTIKHTHPTTKPTTKPTIKHTQPTTKPTTKPTINPTTKLMITQTTHPVPTTDPAIGCKADGYVYAPSTKLCLKFFESPKLNWTDAQNYCNSSKGQLAIITGDQKIKDVLAFYKDGGHTSPLWVGATDFGNGHVFTFTDGSKITVDPSQGKDLKGYNCLYVTGGFSQGYGPCPDRHGFICERSSTIRA